MAPRDCLPLVTVRTTGSGVIERAYQAPRTRAWSVPTGWWGDQVVLEGVGGGSGARRHADLGEDVLQVPANRVLADGQRRRDLLVRQAGRHQPQHLHPRARSACQRRRGRSGWGRRATAAAPWPCRRGWPPGAARRPRGPPWPQPPRPRGPPRPRPGPAPGGCGPAPSAAGLGEPGQRLMQQAAGVAPAAGHPDPPSGQRRHRPQIRSPLGPGDGRRRRRTRGPGTAPHPGPPGPAPTRPRPGRTRTPDGQPRRRRRYAGPPGLAGSGPSSPTDDDTAGAGRVIEGRRVA